jgi:VanZ family protein
MEPGSVIQAGLVRLFFRLFFWSAVIITFYMTLRPITVLVPGSDKTQHAVTFGALMLIAVAAYPRSGLILLAVALSSFGATIELVQPLFGRSRDVWDWVADSMGVFVVLLPIVLVRAARAKGQRD